MKYFLPLFLLLFMAAETNAQIKIDSGYTVLSKGLENEKNPLPFLLGDLNKLIVKENASGKTCMPVSMQWTFIIESSIFQTTNRAEVNNYVLRLKPKDKIFIEKMVFPAGCFSAPKEIAITIY